MKTFQPLADSTSKTSLPKISVPRELVDISMLSALGWSLSLLLAIYLASSGPSYSIAEIASLTALP
jgi:hypothetical protein